LSLSSQTAKIVVVYIPASSSASRPLYSCKNSLLAPVHGFVLLAHFVNLRKMIPLEQIHYTHFETVEYGVLKTHIHCKKIICIRQRLLFGSLFEKELWGYCSLKRKLL
jgi:hypothetical protein